MKSVYRTMASLALSSVSSICCWEVLIFICSLLASSDMRSWFFLSSPWAKESSLALRSSLAMAVLPDFRATFSAMAGAPGGGKGKVVD